MPKHTSTQSVSTSTLKYSHVPTNTHQYVQNVSSQTQFITDVKSRIPIYGLKNCRAYLSFQSYQTRGIALDQLKCNSFEMQSPEMLSYQ